MSITYKTIADKAIIVKVSISAWNGRIEDKKITKETNSRNGVDQNRGSYKKAIMQSDELNAITNTGQKLRNYLKSKSLPWRDGGWRLVKMEDFITIKHQIDDFKAEFEDYVKIFIAKRDLIILADKAALTTAFNLSDYPDKNTLESRFDIRFTPEKVASNDFRNCGWDQATIDQMEKNALIEFENRIMAGKAEMVSILREKIVDFLEALNKGRFKQNSLDNIQEAIASVRYLNITGDNSIEELVKSIESVIPRDGKEVRSSETEQTMAKESCVASIEAIDAITADFLG
jgi:hypothetical protein